MLNQEHRFRCVSGDDIGGAGLHFFEHVGIGAQPVENLPVDGHAVFRHRRLHVASPISGSVVNLSFTRLGEAFVIRVRTFASL